MAVAGAFVDLSRTSRAIGMLATQSSSGLSGGKLTNVARALEHERSMLRSVLTDLHAEPAAFTGARDAAAGARQLDSALVDISSAIDAVRGAAKTTRGTVHLEHVMTEHDTSVIAHVRNASESVHDASRQLGGRRALPEYEQGPPLDRAQVQFADATSRAVVGPGHRPAQRVARWILQHGLGQALGVRSVNASTLPSTGRTVLAPNHVSWKDPLHALALVQRPVRPMVRGEFFDVPVLGSLLRRAGAYPVKHGDAKNALANARTILDQDEALLIYPHGMLLHGNIPGAHGTGAAQVASELRATITPMGTWGAGLRASRTPANASDARPPLRPMVSVAFGEPITPPASPTLLNQANLRERVARAQDDLISVARAHHDERVEAARRRAPFVYGGTAAAIAGAGAGGWAMSLDRR